MNNHNLTAIEIVNLVLEKQGYKKFATNSPTKAPVSRFARFDSMMQAYLDKQEKLKQDALKQQQFEQKQSVPESAPQKWINNTNKFLDLSNTALGRAAIQPNQSTQQPIAPNGSNQ